MYARNAALLTLLSLVLAAPVGCGRVPDADAMGASARTAATQQPGETVPRELALALLSGYGPPGDEDAPQLVVGRAPEGFPQDALPPGAAAVLGAVVHARGSTVAVSAPEPPAEALASYGARLGRAGWRQGPEGGPRRGFVPGPGPRHTAFCRDDTFLSATAVPRSEGGSYIKLHHARNERFSPCNRAREEGRVRSPMHEAPIPTLQAPAGAETRGLGSSGGGMDAWEAHTRLETQLDPAGLVAHYAAQLREAGWALSGQMTGEGVVVQTARTRDERGQTWHGLLTAFALPGTGEREVVFRVMRPSTRPS